MRSEAQVLCETIAMPRDRSKAASSRRTKELRTKTDASRPEPAASKSEPEHLEPTVGSDALLQTSEARCRECADVIERRDVPHVIRPCPACGRDLHIAEPGAHGIGVQVRKGDRFSIPAGWLTFSFDPTKARGTFSREGMDWFAQNLYFERAPKRETIREYLEGEVARVDELIAKSPLTKGLDLESETGMAQAISALSADRNAPEYWTVASGMFLSVACDAMKSGEADEALWAAVMGERFRAMQIFKDFIADTLFMGHSARRLVDIMEVWSSNKNNNDEEFWQIQFKEHSYVISQIFAAPLVLIQDKAYVGGMQIGRNDARFVDYLFSVESSSDGVLVEIKTPGMKLLAARRYRTSVYAPSSELAGAVVQALDYRRQYTQNVSTLIDALPPKIEAIAPRVVIIAGNISSEFTGSAQRTSFELFRRNQRDVEIVTYDELFRKVEHLAALFNLVRRPAPKK